MNRFVLFVNDYFLGIGRKREYIETIQSIIYSFKNIKLGVQYGAGKMGIFFFKKVPL